MRHFIEAALGAPRLKEAVEKLEATMAEIESMIGDEDGKKKDQPVNGNGNGHVNGHGKGNGHGH